MEQRTIVHLSSAKSWRGGENQISLLMQGLKELGMNQILFAPTLSPLAIWAEKEGFTVKNYKKKGPLSIMAALKLKVLSKKISGCVWHIHDSHAHNIAFLAALLFKSRNPWILTRRVLLNNDKKGLSLAKYNHSSLKYIVGISTSVANQLKASIHKNIPITVIPSSIEKHAQNEKGQLRKKYRISENSIIVGYVAAFTQEKDHKTFIKVAANVIQKEANVYFVCIGAPGESSPDIIKEIQKDPLLQSKVIITGFIENPQDFMADFDICLSTSLSEGLGTSMLECMGLGIPVISTRSGGIEDWIIDGKNGLLVPIRDRAAMKEKTLLLIRNKKLRESLGNAGKNTMNNYTPHSMAKKYYELYQTI